MAVSVDGSVMMNGGLENVKTLDASENQFNKDDEQLIENERRPNLETPRELDANGAHKPKPQICGMTRGLALLIMLSTVFAVSITTALIIQISVGNNELAIHGAVASESTLCSNVGVEVLKDKGNAVDAAVATLFCLGVTENQHSGVGGGSFMLIHDHGQNTSVVIDSRETAPSVLTAEMFDEKRDSRDHIGLKIGVPGQVKGLEHAHKKYGKLSWSRLIEPSIKIAREGFNLSEEAVKSFNTLDWSLIQDKNLTDLYKVHGKVKSIGTLIKRPKLARLYQAIADHGSAAIYEGEVAEDIIETVTDRNGVMTLDDLKNYQVIERDALFSTLTTPQANYTVVTFPVPGGGPVLVNILNIVSGLNWTLPDLNTPQRYYELLEAFRYGYAAQSGLADPAFDHNGTVKATNTSMTSSKVAMQICDAIRQGSTTRNESEYLAPGALPSSSGTTHVSVVDSEELYVTVTSTVNAVLGAKVMTSSGILLNDEMMDFTPKSLGTVNYVEGGKRPLSSMTPAMLFDNKQACGPRFAVGGINASHIIAGVAEVIINHLLFNMTLTEAIARPRIINTLSPVTYYEEDLNNVNPALVPSLVKRGYTLQPQSKRLSFILAVGKINDTIEASSDLGLGGTAKRFR